jgi:hypothetical protein
VGPLENEPDRKFKGVTHASENHRDRPWDN